MAGHSLRYAIAHAADRAFDPAASGRTRIPWHLRAITPEWLTSVICAGAPRAKVEGLAFGTGHVGTSGRQQLLLEYNAAGLGAGLPGSVFAKGTPTLITRISMSTVPSMRIETDFYDCVRRLLEIEAPVGYHSVFDLRSGRSIHLLEDLARTKGAHFPDVTTRISRTQAEDVMGVLAALHGRFFGRQILDRELSDLLSWPEQYQRMARAVNLSRYHFAGFDKAEDVIPEQLWARRDDT